MARPPTEAELEARVTALTADRDLVQHRLDDLRAEFDEETYDVQQLGKEDSALRLGPIEGDIRAATDRLAALDRNLATATAALTDFRNARAAEEHAARQRTIPALVKRHMALTEDAWRAALDLADAVEGMRATGEALAAAAATDDAKRLMRTDAIAYRLRATVAPLFDFGNPPMLNLLTGAAATGVNAHRGKTLVALEQGQLDSIVRVYTDKTEAERARDRIDPVTGRATLHAVKDALGLWRLIVGRRRSRHATAAETDEAA